MIPTDVAAQLRQLADVGQLSAQPPVPGLQRARAIQAQLPDLVPGQRFQATLQRTLADGAFQALVAGREMTLALTGSAKAGDTLELVVVERRPGLIVARPPDAGPLPTSAALSSEGVHAALSPAARLIGFLLGQRLTPAPTPLAGGQPLLGQAEVTAALLAPALRQALQHSGLFYEAHQARWLAGRLALEALRQDPQAHQGDGAPRGPPGARGTPVPLSGGGAAAVASGSIPERLLPLVQQQLDALATGQYLYLVQPWPGQDVTWLIDDPDTPAAAEAEARVWRTRLRLTLPQLGVVEAGLVLSASSLQVLLCAGEGITADFIRRHHAPLRQALSAAGLAVGRVEIVISAGLAPDGEGADALAPPAP